jgi:hypothetical protein
MAKSKLFGSRAAKLPHLVTPGKGGVAGEVADLRADVEATFADLEDSGGVIVVEEFTNLAAAAVAAIKASFPTANTVQTFTAHDGPLGEVEIIPPRNVTVTASTHADVDAVPVTITGRIRDANGVLVAQTDAISPVDGGGTTVAGTKAFSFIDTTSVAAMAGPGGALQIGIGTLVGLKKKVRTVAALPVVLQQITDGALVTNGTFNAAAAPHGTWAPSTAANGAHDYGLVYAVDPA